MKKVNLLTGGMLAFLLVAAAAARAEQPEKKVEVSGPYRVAVLPFEAKGADKERPAELGNQIADLLTGLLSTDPNLELVERTRLDKITEEHALNLTGMGDPEEGLRLGRLSGAQFLILGRAFPLDEDICIVAKVVSVETGKMTAVMVQGPASGKLALYVGDLSKGLSGALREKGPALLPALREKEDVIEQIKKAIEGAPLPRVLIAVNEIHRSRVVEQVDPAVATELLFILKSCGFEVAEVKSAKKTKEVREWATKLRQGTQAPLPRAAADADVVVVGDAISEFGARRGELISCIARLELKAVDARTGSVLAVARKTVRAVDLSEVIAAKTALQEGTAAVAASFIPWTVEEWVASVVKEKTKG